MVFDKKFIAFGAVAVVIAVGALWFFAGKDFSKGGGGGAPEPAPSPAPITAETPTREAAPANVTVPGENATSTPTNVVVPNIVSRGNPNNASVSYRGFAIRIENDEYIPDTVIVKVGDTIDINLAAIDKDYDFTQPDFGFKTAIAKGQTARVQFGATVSGKFMFYCKSCGGPAAGPIGYIVIAKQ